MNKEINRHIRALTYDNTSLEDYKIALPFVIIAIERYLLRNYYSVIVLILIVVCFVLLTKYLL